MGCCSSRLARKGPRPGQTPTPSIAAPFLSTMPQYAEQNTGPINAQDIVFSCCVCHDTLSEVYDEPDRHLGLHHQPNQAEGRITKLYLTACAHVVCAKHLEGGGESPDIAVKCLWPELIPSASRCTFPSVGAAPQGALPFLQGFQNRRHIAVSFCHQWNQPYRLPYTNPSGVLRLPSGEHQRRRPKLCGSACRLSSLPRASMN